MAKIEDLADAQYLILENATAETDDGYGDVFKVNYIDVTPCKTQTEVTDWLKRHNPYGNNKNLRIFQVAEVFVEVKVEVFLKGEKRA
jgi:hypothetical protein